MCNKNATSQEKLAHAVIVLMRTKTIDQLTVADVCHQAHLARSTFYRHYHNLTDFFMKYLDQIFHRNLQIAVRNKFDLRKSLIQVLSNIYHHQAFFRVLFGKNSNLTLENAYLKRVITYFQTAMNLNRFLGVKGNQQKIFNYSAAFWTGGIFGIVRHWLNKEHPERPQELAQIIFKIFPVDYLENGK